jgi:hypothetical protein
MYRKVFDLDQEPAVLTFRLRPASVKRVNSIATPWAGRFKVQILTLGSDRRIACMPFAILAAR